MTQNTIRVCLTESIAKRFLHNASPAETCCHKRCTFSTRVLEAGPCHKIPPDLVRHMDHGILLSVDELGTVKAKQRRLLRSRVRARLCFFPFSVLRHSWIGGDNGFSITCVPSAAVVHWLAALTLSTGCITEFLLAHLHRNSAWSRLVEVRLYATVTQNKHGHFQKKRSCILKGTGSVAANLADYFVQRVALLLLFLDLQRYAQIAVKLKPLAVATPGFLCKQGLSPQPSFYEVSPVEKLSTMAAAWK